jgi:hypothetical protein
MLLRESGMNAMMMQYAFLRNRSVTAVLVSCVCGMSGGDDVPVVVPAELKVEMPLLNMLAWKTQADVSRAFRK